MSWLNRKPKNRRLKHDNVLDVKLRSDQVRSQRIRIATAITSVFLTLAFGLLVLWRGGQWLMDRLLYTNDSFAIRHIEIQNDGVLSSDQLRKWAGVKTNDNLLALDLSRVKRDLLLVPVIKSVSVDRVLPGTLRLLVTEREPVAQVYTLQPRAKGGGYDPVLYHLDGAGYVIQPVDPRMRSAEHPAGNEHYPTITGVPASEMRPGRCIESRQLKAALELVQAFDSSPMVGLVGIGRIDLSVPEVLRVNTESGTEILFGLDGIDRQLARWRLIHDLGIKMGRSVASLDLSVTNNLPARWAEAEVLPSGSPAKPAKTTRTRKKNV